MFRKDLEEKLGKIFGLKKTSLNAASDQFEQDVLFIEIGSCKSKASDGEIHAKVTGRVLIYAQDNKMPYGFFTKRIEKADKALTKDFFFHDIDFNNESSPARLQNITERSASFVFLYSAQYDPNLGTIESFTVEESE